MCDKIYFIRGVSYDIIMDCVTGTKYGVTKVPQTMINACKIIVQQQTFKQRNFYLVFTQVKRCQYLILVVKGQHFEL